MSRPIVPGYHDGVGRHRVLPVIVDNFSRGSDPARASD